MDSSAAGNHNKVKVMATQLLAKFEENAPAQQSGLKRQVGGSRVAHFQPEHICAPVAVRFSLSEYFAERVDVMP